MLNFSVGPVELYDYTKLKGSEQIPYFRTEEFSNVMFENEKLLLKFANAPSDSKVVFITGSGSAAMESALINTLSSKDKALVVNGGSFGQRFIDILEIYKIPFTEIKIEYGKKLNSNDLEKYNNQGYTAFLVNLLETSTGVLYDLSIIHNFCKNNNLFLIVDSISSFLSDSFDMSKFGVDLMICGSQKALACPPGISFLILTPKSIEKINSLETKSFYLDLKKALKDGNRGQTPFTPAVGILLQINQRLKIIEQNGGANYEINKIKIIAEYFRNKVEKLPLEIFSESLSNTVTPLHPIHGDAYRIFCTLKDEYGIWICPNGGELKHSVFRVGHIGNITLKDVDKLINALEDMNNRGLL